MNTRTCGNCRHWEKTENDDFGECHRLPPQIHTYKLFKGTSDDPCKSTEYLAVTDSDWPEVHRDRCCGEWNHRRSVVARILTGEDALIATLTGRLRDALKAPL